MTRRPPMPPDGNIRRAHQRMAPGGRLWSESPVKGPAVRVVAAGDDPPTPDPTPPTSLLGSDTVTSFDSSYTIDTPAPGQALVAVCVGVNISAWTIPSGWQDKAGGTVGTLVWRLAIAASDTPGLGLTFTTTAGQPAMVTVFTYAGDETALSLFAHTAATAPGATSVAVVAPTVGWALPVQHVGASDWYTAPFGLSFSEFDAASSSKSGAVAHVGNTSAAGIQSGSVTSESGQAINWVSPVFGWVS